MLALPLAAQAGGGNPAPSNALVGSEALALERPTLVEHPAAQRGRAFYRWSVALLAAASAADVASSWGRPEANPVLAGRGSPFGPRSVSIKLGLLGSCFLLERRALHRRPDLYRQTGWMNVAIAAAHTLIVRHNVAVR
jgi:hypothetical protein